MNLAELETTVLDLVHRHGIQTMLMYLRDFDKNIGKNDYHYFKVVVDSVVAVWEINETDLYNSSIKTEEAVGARRIVAYLLQANANLSRENISKFLNCSVRSVNKYKKEYLERVGEDKAFYVKFNEKNNLITEKINQTQYGK